MSEKKKLAVRAAIGWVTQILALIASATILVLAIFGVSFTVLFWPLLAVAFFAAVSSAATAPILAKGLEAVFGEERRVEL